MSQLREYTELKKILGSQLRSSKQVNKLFESDCEIIKLSSKYFLTTSIDSIGEEISIGLYKNIETWAWLAVMISVSDLAASGSTPAGLTLSTQWAFGTTDKVQKKFFASVNKACRKAEVPLIGGDSGFAKDHVFTSSVLGHSSTQPLMRTKVRDGDYIVLAHKKNVGVGPALAFRFLLDAPEKLLPENIFRPCPSWKLAQKIKPYANAAIDTSDGIATALYTLAQLNDLGFTIDWSEKINHPQAMKFCSKVRFSPVMLWLGDHGDFQTVFVIPEKNIGKISSPEATILGRFHKTKKYQLNYKSHQVALPVKEITSCPRDIHAYSELIKTTLKYLSQFT